MSLVLQLFGGLRLFGKSGELLGLTERAGTLLAYLTLATSSQSRKTLAELHSESGEEQQQRAALRQTLYLVRKLTAEDAIVTDASDNLLLNNSVVEADVLLFRANLAKGDRSSLENAVNLYRGPFLEGVRAPSAAYEQWLLARRGEFLEKALKALLGLASRDAAEGKHDQALAYARHALALDPLDEAAHRQVMTLLAAVGQRTSALRHYDMARQRLANELGVEPEAETSSLHKLIAHGNNKGGRVSKPDNSAPAPFGERLRMPGWLQKTTAVLLFALITGSGIVLYYYPQQTPSNEVPSLAILPFVSENGSATQNQGFQEELTTILSTNPEIKVVSPNNLSPLTAAKAQQRGVRYVLEGSAQNSPGRFQVSVQLIEAATGEHLWASFMDETGDDVGALQEQIAYRIYESLVGLTGEVQRHEQRLAWRKPTLLLNDTDYALRGQQLLSQFTEPAYTKALRIFEDGLSRFPSSTELRLALAFAYRHAVERGWSKHPDEDLTKAWMYANEAILAPRRSRLEQWMSHWIMAKLAQWCKGDFETSVAEARAAVRVAPYDATSRADLAELVANAGETDLAIEWLQESLLRDPKGPEWYRGNLAWAYYLAGRHEHAFAELQRMIKPRRPLLTVVYMKMGRLQESRKALGDFMAKNPSYTVADAARWPLIDRFKRRWLEDLRQAGLGSKI